MIYDSLGNFSEYSCLHKNFKNVREFIRDNSLQDMTAGKHEVNIHGAFLLIEDYQTKEISEGYIECHRKYIDIQIILEGREIIGACHIEDCKAFPYDPVKDFQKLEGEVSLIKMTPDRFTIFFPRDWHMTRIKYGDIPVRVKKAVFKIPVPGIAA